MKNINEKPFSHNGFFILQDNNFLNKQRKAGKIAAKVLNHLEHLVLNKTTLSTIELDNIAEKIIIEAKATPTFKNYKEFPANICCSINNVLVHGISNEYKLKEGDVVKFDVGVTYEGAIADSAITCIYGAPKCDLHIRMINATKEALDKAIASISVDKKIGVIGNAIYKSAKNNGFNVITEYGGHCISMDKNECGILHAQPFISNKSNPDEGFRIQPGLIIAIEPMFVIGETKTHKASDGWAVITSGISSHEEHTVFVHSDKVEVITRRDNLDEN